MALFDGIIGRGKGILNWFLAASLLTKVVVTLLVLGILWFGVRPVVLGSSSQKIQYQTDTAQKGTLITSVTGSGTVSSGNSTSITTSASGVVNEVFVRNGEYVTQGENLATLTLDAASQQKQIAAWASYLSAQNSLNAAKSKMNSLQSALFTANQKFVTDAGTQNPDTADPKYIEERADWQQAESDYNNQQGVIQAAEASLSSAYLTYNQISGTISAPMSGTLSNFTLTPGMAISGGSSNSSSSNSSSSTTTSSQSIGTISLSNGTPQATVNLTQIDITKVTTGQKVTMTLDAFPDKTFTGRVSAIDTNGTTSSGVTNYPVTITFDTAVDKLYPNMAVTATIITAVKNDVLLVPTSAIQTTNGQSTVRILKNGQPQSVDVEIGDSNDTQTEVTSGLSEGDTVITGQTGGATSRTGAGGTQTASPFGGTGFGGARGGGGGGGRTVQFRSFGG